MDRDKEAFGWIGNANPNRHFPRVAKLTFCLAAIFLSLSGCGGREQDGNWQVTAMNGHPIRDQQFSITIKVGSVVGGFDGCNRWGRDPSNPEMITSDAMECPRDADAKTYLRVVQSPKPPKVSYDGHTLRLERANELLVAVRAESIK
jgi:hypothetical protein